MVWQAQKVDEEARGNGRHDHIADGFGKSAQRRGKDTQGTAVAHFQKLSDGECPGFAITIKAVSGQTEQHGNRHQQTAPETDGDAGLVGCLHLGNQRNYRQADSNIRDGNHITPTNPTGSQIIGHSVDITPGPVCMKNTSDSGSSRITQSNELMTLHPEHFSNRKAIANQTFFASRN